MAEDDGNATKKDLAELEARIDKKLDSMQERISEQMRDIETAMLRAFHGYAQGDALKFKY